MSSVALASYAICFPPTYMNLNWKLNIFRKEEENALHIARPKRSIFGKLNTHTHDHIGTITSKQWENLVWCGVRWGLWEFIVCHGNPISRPAELRRRIIFVVRAQIDLTLAQISESDWWIGVPGADYVDISVRHYWLIFEDKQDYIHLTFWCLQILFDNKINLKKMNIQLAKNNWITQIFKLKL